MMNKSDALIALQLKAIQMIMSDDNRNMVSNELKGIKLKL